MSVNKIPRSQTINEGIRNAASGRASVAGDRPSRPSTSKSMLWGWLGFGGTDKTTGTTSAAASLPRTRQSVSITSAPTGGSASLRRWASLVSENPGAEGFGRPSTTDEPAAVTDVSSTSVPSDERMSVAKRKTEFVSPKGAISYEVGDGDTLQSIAVKHNITVGEITKLNRFTTRILFPGQVINVPDPNYVPEPPPPPPPEQATKPVAPDEKEQAATEADYECVEKFVKARALYLPNKTVEDAVPGTLLITPNAVMFDPSAVAALVDQQIRDLSPKSSEGEPAAVAERPPLAPSKSTGSTSSLPPGDLLLPMSWIASVTIFRQIPGAKNRTGTSPVPNSRGQNKTISVTSIGEETEAEPGASATGSTTNLADSVPPTENAFDQSSSGQPRPSTDTSTTTTTPVTSTTATTTTTSAASTTTTTVTTSTTANKAVAAVSESANAITEMSSHIAGAIGTPFKRISLGTLAKVEPAFSQSVETFSLQSGGEIHLSDPAAPTSMFLRIIGTSSLADDAFTALGIGGSSTTTANSSSSSKSVCYPEYWFRIPAKCARGLQHFFTHWNPEMAGNGSQNNPPSTPNTAGKIRVVGFRALENNNNNKNNSRSQEATAESSLKEWEVISIDESVKRNQAEDAEIMRSLPLPEMQGTSTILLDDYIRELCTILPPICIGATWTLLYSSVSHGFSLSSLFRAAAFADSPQLLVIQELSGSVFGAVSSCQFRISDHFYGSSDCCLFTFFPTFRVFRWSGENSFFIKSNRESLCFGSANGVNGLWVDSELYRGRTQRCGTYGNDLLTSTEDFTIAAVELWGFPSS